MHAWSLSGRKLGTSTSAVVKHVVLLFQVCLLVPSTFQLACHSPFQRFQSPLLFFAMHIQVSTSDGRSINYRIKALVENTHVTRVSIRTISQCVNITVEGSNNMPASEKAAKPKALKPKVSRIGRFRVISRQWKPLRIGEEPQ